MSPGKSTEKPAESLSLPATLRDRPSRSGFAPSWSGPPAAALATKTGKRPTAPVSPADPPSDAMIFQDAADPAKKYYLPRYRLAEESVSGQTRYRMALETRGSGMVLYDCVREVSGARARCSGAQRSRTAAHAGVCSDASNLAGRLSGWNQGEAVSGGSVRGGRRPGEAASGEP